MKIGEAWQTYSVQNNDLWEQKRTLMKQQKNLTGVSGKESELDTVTIELANVDEKYNAVHGFMENLLQMKTEHHNAAVSEQQGEAWAKAAEDASKCMEIARRIASGGKVPPADAEKLMKFNPQMYMQALNAAAMNEHKSHKEYESMWEDEEGNENQNIDVDAEIDNMECSIEAPVVTSENE